MAKYFSEKDIEEFRECFYLYAKRGSIQKEEELAFIMRSLGFSPTKDELHYYFTQNNKDGGIEFGTFLDVMHSHSQVENCQKEIVEAFQACDPKRTGTIPVSQFKHIMTNFGETVHPSDVDSMLRQAGHKGGNTVRYNDLLKIMLTPIPDY